MTRAGVTPPPQPHQLANPATPAVATRTATTAWYRRRGVAATAAIAAAWVLCWLAGLAGLHWITLLAVVAGTAALLRGRHTLLDRAVVTVVLLAGTTCAVALGLSVWPWGIDPTVLGGSALTVLILVAALTGRRPAFGRIAGPAEPVTLLGGATFALLLAWPFLGQDITTRLALVMRSEDLARHFAMYDTIRRVGGYAFLKWDEAQSSIAAIDKGYPAGAHVIAAVVDNFVTSTAVPGDPLDSLGRFIWFDVACYVFLAVAVLWAAQRIGGPATTALGFVPVAGTIVAFLLFGAIANAFLFGFLPQLLGLAFLAALMGVAARPLHSTREQLLVLAGALVAVAFTYYFLLPIAGLTVLAHLWLARRRLRRHWLFAAAVAVVTGPLCLVPHIANPGGSGWTMITTAYGVIRVERPPVLAIAALVVAGGLITRSWWRTPTMVVTGITIASAAAMALAIGLIQLQVLGRTVYFLDKSLHTLIVVLLVGLGALAPAASRMIGDTRAGRRNSRLAAAGAGIALAIVPLAALGALEKETKVVPGTYPNPEPGISWGRALIAGRLATPVPARNAVLAAHHVGGPDSRITVIETGAAGADNDHRAIIFAAVLQGNFPAAFDAFVWSFTPHDAKEFEAFVSRDPQRRYRIVTSDDTLLASMRALDQRRPELDLEVVDIRTLSGPS